MLEAYSRGEQFYRVRMILEGCKAFQAGRLGIVEVSGKLCGFHPLDLALDLYLGVFMEVFDQAYEFPRGPARLHWNREALVTMDAEVAQIEAEYRERVATACDKLVEILDPVWEALERGG